METSYLTNGKGERIGVVLSIEEYERLRGIEEEMDDLKALRAARETKAAIERGEEEVIAWDQAVREIREGKVSGGD